MTTSQESYEFTGVMTALSSIHHSGGQSLGITSMLRREKIVQLDGQVEEVPVLSGNGLRGLLRDRGMAHCCRMLGYGVDTETGEVRGLSLPAFYFLFSGGTLTKESSKGLDLNRMRRIRELIPLVGVFGGAFGNNLLPGKLEVRKAYPLCREVAHLLPERIASQATQSVFGYLQQEMYTRKDDAKNEHMRALLSGDEQACLDAGMEPLAAPDRETGQHQQMMYHVETFAAGTRFLWQLLLHDVTPLEFEAFLVTLVEFGRRPTVGGKAACGHGHVAVTFDGWRRIDARVAPEGEAIGATIGSLYRTHLETRGDEIRSALADME